MTINYQANPLVYKPDFLLNKQVEAIVHRFLRKVDCSTYISLWNIHFNKTRALVAGTKQSRHACYRLGSPDCSVSMPAWSAHLPCWPACFVLCPLLALAFQSVFLLWPLTLLSRKTRQCSLFLIWCLCYCLTLSVFHPYAAFKQAIILNKMLLSMPISAICKGSLL
jgi:hypothetical protein